MLFIDTVTEVIWK